MSAATPLLEVRDLHVSFPTRAGPVRAVNGVSLTVEAGEHLGVVGESGAGKSVTALAVMGLLPPRAQVSGQVLLRGTDLLALPARRLRRLRGRDVAMVFQDPATCLNPRMTVGEQIAEAIRTHRDADRRTARRQAVALLRRVGIPAPDQRADEYPHRLSGGMAQRVMIAMAVSCRPALLLADEPTTALDVSIEAQIVDLLRELSAEHGTAVVLITHDLALQARFADRVAVLYAGRVVEAAGVDTLFQRPSHPYTWGLLQSLTRPDAAGRRRLTPIPGTPPSALDLPAGCAFHPRCPHAESRCREEVPALTVRALDDHPSACHFAGELPRPDAVRETAG